MTLSSTNKIVNTLCRFGLLVFLICGCNNVQNSRLTSEALKPFKSNPEIVIEQPVKTLSIGDQAPDFYLPGTDGQYHKKADYDHVKILVVIFTCNHCPTAKLMKSASSLFQGITKQKEFK